MAPPCAPPFAVRRREPELLPPAAPTPHEFKRLSDIDDQDGLRSFVPIIQYYPGGGAGPLASEGRGDRDPVKVIRDALARALVFYYPLAGRLREVAARKLVVECTGEGVVFVEADADVRLEQITGALHPPIPFLGEVLHDVPGTGSILHCPLILMQVTRLRCGGFIVAVRFNHTMADGPGIGQFMTAVAELARGAAAPSVPPVWARELLEARDPPRVSFFHREYGQSERHRGAEPGAAVEMEHRSFFFGRAEIEALRRHMPPHLRGVSTFDIITASLWRCRTAAIDPCAGEQVSVLVIVNARSRRFAELGLPRGYYGNAMVYTAAATTAGELCGKPVSYAVELLREAKAAVTTEYIRSTLDMLAVRGRPLYATAGAYLVSDAMRTGLEGVDYGWGKPLYGGPAWGRVASFHLPSRNSKGEEGIAVPHYLPRRDMDRFAMELEKLIKEEPPMIRSSM